MTYGFENWKNYFVILLVCIIFVKVNDIYIGSEVANSCWEVFSLFRFPTLLPTKRKNEVKIIFKRNNEYERY